MQFVNHKETFDNHPRKRQFTARFDIEILGVIEPQKPKGQILPSWVTAWIPSGAQESPPCKAWKIRVLSCPDSHNFPLTKDSEHTFPQDLFDFSTFIGDLVDVGFDGESIGNATAYRNGFQPPQLANYDCDTALELLRLFHQEVTGATDEFPLNEVAGRSKHAGILLDTVMGEPSFRKQNVRGEASQAHQAEAIRLAADVIKHLGIDNIRLASRICSSHPSGCRYLVEAAAKNQDSDQNLIEEVRGLAISFMHLHWPRKRASAENMLDIGKLLAMAAQADENYGPGTGKQCLDRVFGLGN